MTDPTRDALAERVEECAAEVRRQYENEPTGFLRCERNRLCAVVLDPAEPLARVVAAAIAKLVIEQELYFRGDASPDNPFVRAELAAAAAELAAGRMETGFLLLEAAAE